MVRYFPVFIIGVLGLVTGLAGTAIIIAFIYLSDASMEQRAAPLLGTAVIASLIVTAMNIAIMRGNSAARKGLALLLGASLMIALPSLLMGAPPALAVITVGAPAAGLWAICSRRYGEMLENLQTLRRINQHKQGEDATTISP